MAPRFHIICGICGCNNSWYFEYNEKGKNIDGNFYPCVDLRCLNCGALSTLDEEITDNNLFEEKNE